MAGNENDLMTGKAYRTHVPVLLEPVVDHLLAGKDGLVTEAVSGGYAPRPVWPDWIPSPGLEERLDGVYIDATLGGGGHSARLLARLGSGGAVYGMDQDPEALAAARGRIGSDPRFHPIQGNFAYLDTLLPPEHLGRVQGVLFDLGVSTHQIQEPARGFSFQADDAELDMRMSPDAPTTAKVVVNETDPDELRRILWQYGEERHSRAIVRAIVDARPLRTTGDLRRAVLQVVKGPMAVKSLARVFQAVRIEVNQELESLRSALNGVLRVLAPGGRLVVLSYHSLEDRIVKNFLKCGNLDGTVDKDFYGHPVCTILPLTRQLLRPDEQEILTNPAARSARMRVGVRTTLEV